MRIQKNKIFLALLFLIFSITTAQNRATDSLALVELYDSCDGTSWQNANNWRSSEPINKWQGVVMNTAIDRVIKLRLKDRGITGKIPESFGDLMELTVIILSVNSITEPKLLNHSKNCSTTLNNIFTPTSRTSSWISK